MTETLRLRRRRRVQTTDGIPSDLRAWFAGESTDNAVPWSALLAPHYERLREHWRAWLAMHPGAKPPAQLSSLIDDL